jgi:hypothetical protein
MKNKTLPLGPGVPEEFVTKFGEHVKFALCGWDRLILRGTLRSLFSPRRARAYLSTAGVLMKDFGDWAKALTGRVRDAAMASAKAAGRPYQYLYSPNTDKLGLAREIMARDHVNEGLVAVFGTVEPCTAVTVRWDAESGRLMPAVQHRKCLQLYHYVRHSTFGLCHVRVQTWLPFTVEVWINGREWLSRQMDAAGLAYVKRENFFSELAKPAAAQALFEEQHHAPWPKLLSNLLDATHPLHSEITAPLWGQSYYWSLAQTEYATDLVFKDRAMLAQIYPQFLRHALTSFGSADIMRFLGHVVPATTGRVNGRFHGEAITSHQVRQEGVRIKHLVGQNGIKAYDKHSAGLRIETTLNAPEVFKIRRRPTGQKRGQKAWRRLRRSVADAKRRAQVSRAANARYLQALAATASGQPLGKTAAPLTKPLRRRRQRYRALNPFAAKDAAVLALINRGEFTVEGLRNADVQSALFSGPARTKKQRCRRSAAAGRYLRLLRAHRLIRKVPGRHRYLITARGREAATAFITAQEADVAKLTALAA